MQSVWQADVSDFKKEKIFLYQLPIICHKHVKVPFLVDMNRIIFIAKKAGPFLTRSSQSWEWLWLSSQDTEEGNSPPISLVNQSLSDSPFASPSHLGKCSANGRFTKAAKAGKKKNLSRWDKDIEIMSRKENWTLKTTPAKTNHLLNASQGWVDIALKKFSSTEKT